MDLLEQQHDALCEVVNIAMEHAASQLSILLNDVVEISNAEMTLMTLPDVAHVMDRRKGNRITRVWQSLHGDLSGIAIFAFDTGESNFLLNAMMGSVPSPLDIDMHAYELEAMMEIGNIIISSASAAMADQMGVEVRLSVPGYTDDYTMRMPERSWGEQSVDWEEKVVMIQTPLQVGHRDFGGKLLFAIGLHAVEQTLTRLPKRVQRGLSSRGAK